MEVVKEFTFYYIFYLSSLLLGHVFIPKKAASVGFLSDNVMLSGSL